MRLFEFEKRWAQDVLAGFAPPEGPGLAPRSGEVDYAAVYEKMVGAAGWQGALGIRAALGFAAWAPLWQRLSPRTMAGLRPEQRTAHLRRMLDHPIYIIGEMGFLLKMIAATALLGTPSVRARCGYDGTTVKP